MHSSSSCSNNKCNDNASTIASPVALLNGEETKQACKKAGIPTNAGFSVMGDSISTLGGYIPQGWRCHYEGEVSIPGVSHIQDTWWGQVIEHFGGHLVGNASFSGSTVEGFDFPAGCSPKRAAALVGKGAGASVGADASASADASPTNGTYKNAGENVGKRTGKNPCEIPGGNVEEKPQIVLVFMGINDYGWGGAKNQVMGGSASRTAEPEALGGQVPVAFTVSADALQRFKQAYATMLENIRAVAPKAQLWCLTLSPAVMEGFCSTDENGSASNLTNTSAGAACTTNASIISAPNTAKLAPFIYSVRGIDLDEYNNAIRACVAEAGECAHVADIRSFNIDYESVDNTHPTALGMKQIATMVCACMEGARLGNAEMAAAPAQLNGYPELASAPKSQRHCEKRTCEGCSYSPLTNNSWCLACGKQ